MNRMDLLFGVWPPETRTARVRVHKIHETHEPSPTDSLTVPLFVYFVWFVDLSIGAPSNA